MVLGILALALLPPEHVHARHTDDGRRADVIHRHFDRHHPAAADEPVAHEAHRDDHATQWFDSAFTGPEQVSRVYPDNQTLLDDQLVPRPQDTSPHTLAFVRVSVHDPPGITSNGLRGPPFLVA